MTRSNSKENKKIRYAVVGLGYISQTAVLPAFAHAAENSQLAALVSGDPPSCGLSPQIPSQAYIFI